MWLRHSNLFDVLLVSATNSLRLYSTTTCTLILSEITLCSACIGTCSICKLKSNYMKAKYQSGDQQLLEWVLSFLRPNMATEKRTIRTVRTVAAFHHSASESGLRALQEISQKSMQQWQVFTMLLYFHYPYIVESCTVNVCWHNVADSLHVAMLMMTMTNKLVSLKIWIIFIKGMAKISLLRISLFQRND